MAQKVQVDIVSDLSDEPNAHSVEFGWGGKVLSIDVTEAEHTEWSALMQRYVDKASVLSAKRGRPKSGTAKATASSATVAGAGGSGLTKEQRQEVRDYAKEHGHALSERGRLPQIAITAWQEKNPDILKHLAA